MPLNTSTIITLKQAFLKFTTTDSATLNQPQNLCEPYNKVCTRVGSGRVFKN
ncbi:hypothetical protein M758_2G051400 [Ceratodon purpureus]|nr:hypothetical protein M758_2G051400 [Ceratodon purpureus]